MEINKLQKQAVELINKIDKKNACIHDKETTFIHLSEEVGEIARQVLNEKIERNKINKEKISEEISDCIIFLMKLADNYNIEIESALEDKLKKLKQRFDIQ